MRIAGVIIAGGRSRRMGGDRKMLLPVAGVPIVEHIMRRVGPQVDCLALNSNDPVATPLPVLPDVLTGIGTPLAGLHAALQWAKLGGFEAVLTVPSDSPFLPVDLVARLLVHLPRPAIAASRGQDHFLTGLWPVAGLALLEREIGGGRLVRAKDWVALCGARRVEWPAGDHDPFFNVNTPEDLAEAARIAAQSPP